MFDLWTKDASLYASSLLNLCFYGFSIASKVNVSKVIRKYYVISGSMTYGMDFLKKWTDNVRNEYDGK